MIRKAAVFYNPLSGRRQGRRLRDVEEVLGVLRGAGVEGSATPTQGSASTGAQVREALAGGCDTVFVCGGDGTIHDVAQEMAGSEAALAIVPLGTANALAHDLGLPLSPAAAAQAALAAERRRVAVGKIECQDLSGNRASHLFLVTAGIGVDAHLFYRLDPFAKRRFGMASYYARALHLWLTHRMQNFCVEIGEPDGGTSLQCSDVSQLLAVRIRNFGGVLRELAPGACLEEAQLRTVLFRTRGRMRYLAYILRGLLGARWEIADIELRSAASIKCDYPSDSPAGPRCPRIFVEADGELLGTLPAKVSLVPDGLTLLFPKRRA